MKQVEISQVFCVSLLTLLQMCLISSNSFAKPNATQDSVEIPAVVYGHYVAAGRYAADEFGLSDYSKAIGERICKRAGYNEVFSVTTKTIGFLKGTVINHVGNNYTSIDLVEIPADINEPMHLETYEIVKNCDLRGCEYRRYPIALKSVRCK